MFRIQYINYCQWLAIFFLVRSSVCVGGKPGNQNKIKQTEYSAIKKQEQINNVAERNFNGGDTSSTNGMSEDIFVPTKEWKSVNKYKKIPAGLHVRLNLETGNKEAKLMDNDYNTVSDHDQEEILTTAVKNSDQKNHEKTRMQHVALKSANKKTVNDISHSEVTRENILEVLKHIKNDDVKMPEELIKRKNKFRSYAELKKELKELNMNIESDSDTLSQLISNFRTVADENVQLNILEDLDFLTHQIDNAVNFVDMGGIQKVIQPGLNSSNEEVRKGVMRLLGSASQSNPKVQIAALEEGLLNQLLRVITYEKDASISSKAVYAVSCLVRGFPLGQQRFVEAGGLHTLGEVFLRQDWQSLGLQLKVVSLIQDLLEERMNAEGERAKQLNTVNLFDSLLQEEWCPAISSLLAVVSFDKKGIRHDMGSALSKDVPLRPDHDMIDKITRTMVLLVPFCKHYFLSSLSFIQSLEKTYSDLAYKEQYQGINGHELFGDMASRLQQLIWQIRHKDEL